MNIIRSVNFVKYNFVVRCLCVGFQSVCGLGAFITSIWKSCGRVCFILPPFYNIYLCAACAPPMTRFKPPRGGSGTANDSRTTRTRVKDGTAPAPPAFDTGWSSVRFPPPPPPLQNHQHSQPPTPPTDGFSLPLPYSGEEERKEEVGWSRLAFIPSWQGRGVVIPSSCLDSLTPPPLLNHILYPPPPVTDAQGGRSCPRLGGAPKKNKERISVLKKEGLE